MNVFKKFIRFLGGAYDKQIDATGLAVFRMLYSLILIAEVFYFMEYHRMMYDELPFIIGTGEINLMGAYTFWMVALFFLFVGLYIRVATIINYLFSILFISHLHYFEYHMDFVYMSVNFILMFVPLSRSLSLDNLRLRWKYLRMNRILIPTGKVSQLYYFLVPLIGIAFVYWNSTLHKFTTHLWLNGLGVWLPASLPPITILNDQWILNQRILMKFLGYFVLIFETIFIFTFWFKKLRLPYVIIGVFFHLGIFFEYPIPYFALSLIALYTVIIPVGYWKSVRKSIQVKIPVVTFFYNSKHKNAVMIFHLLDSFNARKAIEFKTLDEGLDEPYKFVDKEGHEKFGLDGLKAATKVQFSTYPISFVLAMLSLWGGFSNRFNRWLKENSSKIEQIELPTLSPSVGATRHAFGKKFAIAGIIILAFFQFNQDTRSQLFRNAMYRIIPKENNIHLTLNSCQKSIGMFSRHYFGIVGHGVFLDRHFAGYDHIIALTYLKPDGDTLWLPITTKEGFPGEIITGPTWAYWGFRVVAPYIEMDQFKRGTTQYLSFWAHKNEVDLTDARFQILLKKMRPPINDDWEKNYLKKLIDQPWVHIGEVIWRDYKATVEVPDIESL